MSSGIGAASQTFIDEMNKLVARIERLERVVRLSLRSIADCTLERAKFVEYLNARVRAREQAEGYGSAGPGWSISGGYQEYLWMPDYIPLTVPTEVFGPENQYGLQDCLLSMAALEGRAPGVVLAEIDPSLMSAVDVLAMVPDPGE